MVRQAAKMLFGLDIRMIVTERLQEKRNDQIIEHVIFTLESTDESIPLIRPNVVAKETAIPMVCFKLKST
jgi:hypothetical protein